MSLAERIYLAPDEIAEREFYAAIDEGLKDVEEGRVCSSAEVKQAMYAELERAFQEKRVAK